jgi:hypothetical protein
MRFSVFPQKLFKRVPPKKQLEKEKFGTNVGPKTNRASHFVLLARANLKGASVLKASDTFFFLARASLNSASVLQP